MPYYNNPDANLATLRRNYHTGDTDAGIKLLAAALRSDQMFAAKSFNVEWNNEPVTMRVEAWPKQYPHTTDMVLYFTNTGWQRSVDEISRGTTISRGATTREHSIYLSDFNEISGPETKDIVAWARELVELTMRFNGNWDVSGKYWLEAWDRADGKESFRRNPDSKWYGSAIAGDLYRGVTTTGSSSGIGVLGAGVYLTWDSSVAKAFAQIAADKYGGEPIVETYQLQPGLRLLERSSPEFGQVMAGFGFNSWDNISDPHFSAMLTANIRDRGYDGVISADPYDGLVVFDNHNVIGYKDPLQCECGERKLLCSCGYSWCAWGCERDIEGCPKCEICEGCGEDLEECYECDAKYCPDCDGECPKGCD